MINGIHAVSTEGSGEPIVLLHGVFFDHRMWDDVVERLGSRPTLAIDMPGHGRSRPLVPGETVEDVADTIAEAVVGKGFSRAIWIGHSWGGMTVARLAAKHPELVSGAVFTNTPTRQTSGLGRWGFIAQRWMLRLGLPAGLYGRTAAKSLIGEEALEARPSLVLEMGERLSDMGRDQIGRVLECVLLDAGDTIELIERSVAPYRVVVGESDYVLTDEVRQRLGQHLSIVSGGHSTPVEHPQALVEAIELLCGDI